MTKEFYIDNLPFDKFFLDPPETIYVTDLCGYSKGTKITFMLEEDGVKEGPYSGYLKLMSKNDERLKNIHYSPPLSDGSPLFVPEKLKRTRD